jgi:hypothetical protein
VVAVLVDVFVGGVPETVAVRVEVAVTGVPETRTVAGGTDVLVEVTVIGVPEMMIVAGGTGVPVGIPIGVMVGEGVAVCSVWMMIASTFTESPLEWVSTREW